MSTHEHNLMRAAEAFATEAAASIQALVSALTATPDAAQGIAARATALQHESARRVRAGVRVVTNPDGFDARHIALLTDSLAASDTRLQGSARCASALSALLTRSLSLLGQMTEALAAPERAAAEAARDEAQALAAAARAKDEDNARRQRDAAALRESARATAIAEGREW